MPTYPGASGALQCVAERSCQYLLDLKRDQNCLILGLAITYWRSRVSFFQLICLREDFKYYFADFVRKGGGGTPKIRNPLFAEKKSVNGGEGGTPQIR